GSFGIDQGVGVRAVSGEKTAFAYSDEISMEALIKSARATRTIAAKGAGKIKVAPTLQTQWGRDLYLPNDPIQSLDAAAKVALLEKV
ncbi:DNA gyrase modulator, partial [Acinetobacter baumannii]